MLKTYKVVRGAMTLKDGHRVVAAGQGGLKATDFATDVALLIKKKMVVEETAVRPTKVEAKAKAEAEAKAKAKPQSK